ncbi:helix-turn-helix transcriptional regulator [Vibrio hangzhouensis]|uniref:Transcriptional regulator, AraC family n=1 Tax=Vibrio hangzhouensis TaxID=462991 RepID=A0A1H6A5X7_9VIBR|nr:AraC family transcriptional regulator [Vibrio hangzhouensis]SEG44149.1 transcriptional regulator, AraC family [Vibrio hangzhouensis]
MDTGNLGVGSKKIIFKKKKMSVDILSIGHKFIRLLHCEGHISTHSTNKPLTHGDLIYIPCNSNFNLNLKAIEDKQITFEVVEIDKSTFTKLLSNFRPVTPSLSTLNSTDNRCNLIESYNIQILFQSIVNLGLRYDDNLNTMIQSLTLSLVCELVRENLTCPVLDTRQSITDKMVELLALDLKSKWKLNDVALRMNMSSSTLHRRLKDEGVEFSRVLNSTRLEMARRMLTYNSQPISLVSINCGFESLSYFSTQFKKKYKLTPREYRKSLIASKSIQSNIDNI